MATFGGVSLLTNQGDLEQLLQTYHPKSLISEFQSLTNQPSDLGALPFTTIGAPKIEEIGKLVWPSGAAQFAHAHFLVDDAHLSDIRDLAYSSNNNSPLELYITSGSDSSHEISADMYMLAPRPISQASGNNCLWLLTLVDDRYWWWYKTGTVTVNEGTTTWATLYSTIASLLDISITVDTIDPKFLKPTRRFNLKNESLPTVLDAVAFSVGQRIVRGYDGTVRARNYTEGQTAFNSNLTTYSLRKSLGGLFYTNPDVGTASGDIAGTVPRKTLTIFPLEYTDTGALTTNYSVLTTVSNVGIDAEQQLWGDQIGYATGAMTTPRNNNDLVGYASALSVAWYEWQTGGNCDITYEGIVPWTQDGFSTVTFKNDNEICSTRVLGGTRNDRGLGGLGPLKNTPAQGKIDVYSRRYNNTLQGFTDVDGVIFKYNPNYWTIESATESGLTYGQVKPEFTRFGNDATYDFEETWPRIASGMSNPYAAWDITVVEPHKVGPNYYPTGTIVRTSGFEGGIYAAQGTALDSQSGAATGQLLFSYAGLNHGGLVRNNEQDYTGYRICWPFDYNTDTTYDGTVADFPNAIPGFTAYQPWNTRDLAGYKECYMGVAASGVYVASGVVVNPTYNEYSVLNVPPYSPVAGDPTLGLPELGINPSLQGVGGSFYRNGAEILFDRNPPNDLNYPLGYIQWYTQTSFPDDYQGKSSSILGVSAYGSTFDDPTALATPGLVRYTDSTGYSATGVFIWTKGTQSEDDRFVFDLNRYGLRIAATASFQVGPFRGYTGTGAAGDVFKGGICHSPGVAVPSIRSGSVAVSVIGGVTYPITFSTPMPSTNYTVAFGADFLTSNVGWSSKTTGGFTITLSAALAGNVDWTVVSYT